MSRDLLTDRETARVLGKRINTFIRLLISLINMTTTNGILSKVSISSSSMLQVITPRDAFMKKVSWHWLNTSIAIRQG